MITYTKNEDPTSIGVYACRVPMDGADSFLLKDEFLMWFNGEWSYTGSDQKYRGEVLGWIGPLQRRIVQVQKKVEPVYHPDCCHNPDYCGQKFDEQCPRSYLERVR